MNMPAQTQDSVVVDNNSIELSNETQAIMSMIQSIALNPEVDVTKLRAVMDMKMEMFNRGAEIEFNAAMAKAQAELVPITKTAYNSQTRSKYALLENIIEQASPIWTKHGFALSFDTGDCPTPGYYRVLCECTHSSGFSKNYKADLPIDSTGIAGTVNKTGTHAFGSTVAYGRRYLTCMIFNIAVKNEDDDGNGKKLDHAAKVLTLTNAQIENLRNALKMANVSEELFCANKNIQISRIEELPQSRMAGALRMLKNFATGAKQ